MGFNSKNLKFTPVIKDPVRFPKVQIKIEDTFKKNFDSSLKVLQIQIVKTLTKNIKNERV